MQNEIYFYIGTYSSAEDKGIYLGALNPDNGEMKLLDGTSGIENATYLDFDELHRVLYAVSEAGESVVVAYSADPETRKLTEMSRTSTDSSGTCHVSRSRDGKYLFTTGYSDGRITVLELGEEGDVGEIASIIRHSGRSLIDDRQSEAHPHSILQDPHHKYVIVSDLGMDEVILYRLEDGKLVTHREISLPPGAGPRFVAFHPSGKWLYGVNELNSTVTVYAYDSTFGDLKLLQHVSTLPEDVVLDNTGAHILASPCGRFLYVSNRGHDSIVQYEIDTETGMLNPVNWVSSGGKTPRHFNMLPGGYLVSANQDNGLIASYKIDKDTGRLEATGHTIEVPHPVCICPVVKAKKE
ncbi:lactonase family protein [Paenibacillus dakarensis]|uniref:lactonase family protein n=1 Tax=Paenibacillus dakarensis TaxID=1527293 RepID=UPI000AADF1E1|nr:lactonase family protein [Paenibacillus dakarensis]